MTSQTHISQYQRWVEAQESNSDNSPRSYLFDEPTVRFTAHLDDVLMCTPGTLVITSQGQLSLQDPNSSRQLALPRVNQLSPPLETLQRLVCKLDGTLSGEQLEDSTESSALVQALIGDAFGQLLFAPLAIANCQQAISATEICRFPGSPYEIGRAYWQNMGAVRQELTTSLDSLQSNAGFSQLLLRLHSLALMGSNFRNYYQPASRSSRLAVEPGRFHIQPSLLRETAKATLIESGLRVGVPAVGGQKYHHLLYQSVEDAQACLPRPQLDTDGLQWGRCVFGRSRTEDTSRAWFCPPRPQQPVHLERLRRLLLQALAPDRQDNLAARISALAHFHQRFVQLHPFACANQSIAMNIVNYALNQLVGAGLPHLILDQLALRLSQRAYALVFERAVKSYTQPQLSLSERHNFLAQARASAFALSAKLERCSSLTQAAQVATQAGEARQLLLLQ